MGLVDSLYRSIQWLICLKMEVYGDRGYQANPLYWNQVVLDLFWTRDYWSDLPWVMKL
jgi:hypothetical protein